MVLTLCGLCLAVSLFAVVPQVPVDEVNEPDYCQSKAERKPFDPVAFKKNLENYIIKEANLTPEEALHFFPLFHVLHENQRTLHRKIGHLSYVAAKKELSEKECEEILESIVGLRKQLAEMQNAAYKAWRKVLPASKILKVMNAEHRFGRHTFHDMVKRKD